MPGAIRGRGLCETEEAKNNRRTLKGHGRLCGCLYNTTPRGKWSDPNLPILHLPRMNASMNAERIFSFTTLIITC